MTERSLYSTGTPNGARVRSGLLGAAFSPDGMFLYVDYTDVSGDTHVTEFAMKGGRVDVGSRRDVLFVAQPYINHNGGGLAFGPDGYLYIGLGDGGSGGDPPRNGQSLLTLLGKIVRISPLACRRRAPLPRYADDPRFGPTEDRARVSPRARGC